LLKPRNCQTKNVKRGKDESIYFERPKSYVCRGDVFKNPPEHQKRGEVKDGYKEVGKQDMQFRPAKTVRDKSGYKAPYEHMTENIQVKINHRDDDGAVMTAPRNVTNKPPKKGRVGPGCSFGGIDKHMPCDYNNARKVALAEYKIG